MSTKKRDIDVISVVIVDDTSTIHEALAYLLMPDPKFEVLANATNGKEGVELAKKYKPDMVLMDIHMPIMDGIEGCKQIKQYLPKIGVLLMSAELQYNDLPNAMLAGADGFIPKPIDAFLLKTQLKEITLYKRRAVRIEEAQIVSIIDLSDEEADNV